MKQIPFIVITFTCTVNLFGQSSEKSDSLIRRLYNEITTSYDVQTKHIGCYGHLSVLYKKVDTLKHEVGLKTFTEYFNDSSVNLKYYAFIELLALNDERAFDGLVKELSSRDSINFKFAGQYNDRVRLLDLLTGEYLGFIKMKYYYGTGCTYHGRSYLFEKRDRKTWRQKHTTALKFIEDNGLSQKWIENYSL